MVLMKIIPTAVDIIITIINIIMAKVKNNE